MTQSRRMSLIEAITNVAVGYALAVVTQIMVFPWFGLHPSLGENLALGGIFTVISLIRGYTLRRRSKQSAPGKLQQFCAAVRG